MALAISAALLSTPLPPLDFGLQTAYAAVEQPPPEGQAKPLLLKRVVILPFENFSENTRAISFVKKAMKEELRKKGLILIAGDDMVDDFLAKRRMRFTNSVTRFAAREMGMVLDADAVMVGSVDIFSEGANGDVRAGITARLVSTIDGSIIWADNIAYTGRDFAGVLGLGAVESLDKLASLVVKDAVKSIPDRFFIRDSSLSPFEAADVVTTPVRVRSGENVRLSVRMLPIVDEPRNVKALVSGKEIPMENIAGTDYYECSVEAPVGEGAFNVDVVAFDKELKKYSFKSIGEIYVDNTPPKLAMKLSRTVFSPKRKGFVVLTPILKNIKEIDEWQIEILNNEGAVVRSDRGFGKLPKELVWKGEANSQRLLEDGEYTYRFIVKDVAGNQTVMTDKLKIKSAAPDIQVDVELSDNKLHFFFGIPSKDETIDSWKLSILDNGKVLDVFHGEGALPPQIEYPIETGYDLSKVTVLVTATDNAGNPFEFKKSIPSILLKKTPFARLNDKSRIVEDF
ncbi:MAG: hypothetical protein HZB22_01275 [Deltaproteobacteria bacterium]|nr:hypothetical protein [Deltaproteobacteria bacterium]